jgi:rubrerythrin
MTDESSAGPSIWARELYAHLTNHLQAENDLLKKYASVAETTESKAFHYLVRLLIEDETRHHRLFTELAESLKDEALCTGKEPAVPYLDFNRADGAAVRRATEELINSEEEDARELRRLHRELRDIRDTSLWTLLVELMQQDTEKHLSILRFVSRHTAR